MFVEGSHSFLKVVLIPEAIAKGAEWGYSLDRKGKAVSTTDLSIAAAAVDRAVLCMSTTISR